MLKYVLFSVVCTVLFLIWIGLPFERIKVAGDSMHPTYTNGQYLWSNQFAYIAGKPQREDIVTYSETNDKGHFLRIGRVIGLPGENIEIKNNKVYINQQELVEAYVNGTTNTADGNPLTMHLIENEYFILGDNRSEAESDSRFIGPVKEHVTDFSNIHTFIGGKVFSTGF